MTSHEPTQRDWVVLLEAADEGSTIEPTSFARMISSWAAPAPTTLYSPDRCAFQVPVRAADPPLALAHAMGLWKNALRRSGLPQWELLRVEVLTSQELEREWQEAERAEDGSDAWREAPRTDAGADALLRRALHDPLTGLPARELFIDEVRRALASGRPALETHAVMVVHLEGLDSVEPPPECTVSNDVVAQIARRLTDLVRRGDTVARVGPADFALLVHAPSVSDTDALARRIADRLRCPSAAEDQPLAVTASVGVATTFWGGDADQLILMAEVAMEAAREAGGDRHRRFAASPDSV